MLAEYHYVAFPEFCYITNIWLYFGVLLHYFTQILLHKQNFIMLHDQNSVALLELCFMTKIHYIMDFYYQTFCYIMLLEFNYITRILFQCYSCITLQNLLHYQNSVTLLEFNYITFCYISGILLCHGIPLHYVTELHYICYLQSY